MSQQLSLIHSPTILCTSTFFKILLHVPTILYISLSFSIYISTFSRILYMCPQVSTWLYFLYNSFCFSSNFGNFSHSLDVSLLFSTFSTVFDIPLHISAILYMSLQAPTTLRNSLQLIRLHYFEISRLFSRCFSRILNILNSFHIRLHISATLNISLQVSTICYMSWQFSTSHFSLNNSSHYSTNLYMYYPIALLRLCWSAWPLTLFSFFCCIMSTRFALIRMDTYCSEGERTMNMHCFNLQACSYTETLLDARVRRRMPCMCTAQAAKIYKASPFCR